MTPFSTVVLGLLFFCLNYTASAQESSLELLQSQDEAVLQRHRPFYFAYGGHTTKVQLSFKSPLVRGIPLYFGYTQLMFWQLGEPSSPFQDSTYNPELFYRLTPFKNKNLHMDLVPLSHNSNGKAEETSRSYNRSTLRLLLEKEFDKWIWVSSLSFSQTYSKDDTNTDVNDFVGPISLQLRWIQLFRAWIDKSEYEISLTPGGEWGTKIDKGGYQISWAFRLGGLDVVPSFYLQYYQGFAETLLNYSERVQEFRGGLIFY